MKKQEEQFPGIPWREYGDSKLRDPEIAAEYLSAAIEEGLDLQRALKRVIEAVGSREFARWVKKMEHPNILRAVRKNSNPTIKTVDQLLRPLGLRLAVARLRPVRT